jgi:citrate synthase
MAEEFAELNIKGQIYKLPIKKASIGQDVVDVTKLFKDSGYFTYDPGFMSTASCTSEITYIDGEAGILRHRGYDINDLASKKDFLDVSYLLLNGELPNQLESKRFKHDITHHSMVSEQMRELFEGFRHSAHPMAVMLSAVGSLSAIYHDNIDVKDPEEREEAAIKIIAKMPTLAAMTYKYSISQPIIYPNNEMCFTENFLHMMFATPCEKYKVNKILAKALDQIFTLHADHEQNASTSTVRTAGSSGANPFACISAGIELKFNLVISKLELIISSVSITICGGNAGLNSDICFI